MGDLDQLFLNLGSIKFRLVSIGLFIAGAWLGRMSYRLIHGSHQTGEW